MNLQRNTQPLTSASRGEHRCFYAVKFNDAVTRELSDVIATLAAHNADVRWTPPGNIHLTLRFLGEITGAQLLQARELMDEARELARFAVAARGLGAFPTLRAPRVLWAGVDAAVDGTDREGLHALQERTERWARTLGLPPESRRYRPHITLGRIARATPGLRALIDDVTTRSFASSGCAIDRVILMRSRLDHAEPRYEELRSVALGGA